MSRVRIRILIVLCLALTLPSLARAGEPFRYPEAKHGKGELRYANGIPVLTVRGTPEEIGEQVGVLGLRPIKPLFGRIHEFAKAWHMEAIFPLLLKTGNIMTAQFPPDHLKELEAAAKASGISRDLLIFGSTFIDIKHVGGCSTLIVESKRSAAGGLLFGRNLDWFPFGDLYQYSLVTIFHPDGKHAFVAVGFPGMVGPPSGMNDAGLALAHNDINAAQDSSAKLDPLGVPTLLAMRLLLEECTSVPEAEKRMRAVRRASMALLTVCDKNQGCAFEITTKNVIVRSPIDGICASTNHFRTKELATVSPDSLETVENCPRYVALKSKSRDMARITVEDLHQIMHAASAGDWTLQTMIFEPGALRLYVALGKGPTSALPLQELDLTKWLRSK
jgi:isopenicillin-N N-acyltransferase like protein